MYARTLPHLANLSTQQRALQSFFTPDQLREELARRNENELVTIPGMCQNRIFFLSKQVLTYTMTSTWTRTSSRSGCISFIVSFGSPYPTWAQEYVLQSSNNGVQGCIHSRWSHLCSLSSRRYDFMSFYWMRYWYGSWFRLSIGQWTSNGFCWTLAKGKTLEYCIDSRSIYYTCVWWSL